MVTHGNGPQVGFILRRSELASKELHAVPLDSCVADTQGALGYHIQLALFNEFRRLGIEKAAATWAEGGSPWSKTPRGISGAHVGLALAGKAGTHVVP